MDVTSSFFAASVLHCLEADLAAERASARSQGRHRSSGPASVNARFDAVWRPRRQGPDVGRKPEAPGQLLTTQVSMLIWQPRWLVPKVRLGPEAPVLPLTSQVAISLWPPLLQKKEATQWSGSIP